MLEQNNIAYMLEWWELDCGDMGIIKCTNDLMIMIMKAESHNVRFVMVDDAVINIAFIRGAKKHKRTVSTRDYEFNKLDNKDIQYLVTDNRKPLLS